MSSTADRVNCYLPRGLKNEFREQFGPDLSFSEVLRRGVAREIQQARAAARKAPADVDP